MRLQPFRVLVDALAVPVYATLHYLGRGACKDYVRLVEPFGNDAAPTYNAVVGDSHILAYLDILAHPYVTAYLNAFGIIDRVSFEVGNRVASVHHTSTPQLNWLSSPMLTREWSSCR